MPNGNPVDFSSIGGKPAVDFSSIGGQQAADAGAGAAPPPPPPQGTSGILGGLVGAGKGLLQSAAETANYAGGLTPTMWAAQQGQNVQGVGQYMQGPTDAGISTPEPVGTAEKAGYWGEKGVEAAGQFLAAGRSVLSAAEGLPSFERAGNALGEIETAIGKTPIDTTKMMEVAQRAKELTQAGHEPAKPITDFLKRMSPKEMPYPQAPDQPAAMTFQEGRDFYSAASKFTDSQMENLSGKMRNQMTQFASALDDSLRTAAAKMGEGERYAMAMKEYNEAGNLGEKIAALKKYGIPVAADALRLGVYYKLFSKIAGH